MKPSKCVVPELPQRAGISRRRLLLETPARRKSCNLFNLQIVRCNEGPISHFVCAAKNAMAAEAPFFADAAFHRQGGVMWKDAPPAKTAEGPRLGEKSAERKLVSCRVLYVVAEATTRKDQRVRNAIRIMVARAIRHRRICSQRGRYFQPSRGLPVEWGSGWTIS
jgi:hypothetical protein